MTAKNILSFTLGLFGLSLISANWYILTVLVAKKKHSSFIPLLGGLFLSISIAIMPDSRYHWLCWFAFVIDFGSLPLLVITVWFFITGKHKK